ncbi:MAG TPA: deoxynucleoside kinase [Bellilinea sp.]|nr:deoxynucleoside kinase [Bellilinea sp.]
MKKFIAVAGNIGVGKSTLVHLLCEKMGWEPFYEPVTENPYIADFYKDMNAWSFHSQVFFLTHRLRIHQRILSFSGSVIQDRSIYEDAEVFAHNLYVQGNLNERDYETYRALYLTVSDFIPPPDLVIYLRATAPTLQRRISLRDRDYERKIPTEYLDQLNKLYEQWINNFALCPVLTVPADDLDFVAHPRHCDLIMAKVQEKLTGKEEVIFSAEEVKMATD